MDRAANHLLVPKPARWAVALAFLLVYLSWGTTYLAIEIGVESFPPALFGGVRVSLAGLILLSYVAISGQQVRVPMREFLWLGFLGILLFVGGNGLLTVGEKFVPSGVSSVLAATTPLWMASLEMLRPRGERLRLLGWIGLLAGLAGVVVLLLPRLQDPGTLLQDAGPLMILGSAFSWSLASCVVRSRRSGVAHLTSAAYQMALGGGCLLVIGLLLGEGRELAWSQFTPRSVYAFFHLLIFGSLVGFVAYNWLLGHVSGPMAGTYAYVNPVVAILVGWLLNSEALTIWIVGGMGIILVGVALVRSSHRRAEQAARDALRMKSTAAHTPAKLHVQTNRQTLASTREQQT